MARKKKSGDPKGFTIKCHECGFSGEVSEYSITIINGCSCFGGGKVAIDCEKCGASQEVDSW